TRAVVGAAGRVPDEVEGCEQLDVDEAHAVLPISWLSRSEGRLVGAGRRIADIRSVIGAGEIHDGASLTALLLLMLGGAPSRGTASADARAPSPPVSGNARAGQLGEGVSSLALILAHTRFRSSGAGAG